jgi:putative NIF3 family GTP cyclohydrolase 1 type 2
LWWSRKFLISKAASIGADIYVTADIKYHEFFDANDTMVVADIGIGRVNNLPVNYW